MLETVAKPIVQTLIQTLRWLLIAIVAGMLAGTASAILIVSLNWATKTREAHPWIVALLPLAGLSVGLMYHYLGRQVEAGNNLLLEQIHAPSATLQLRMTPLILIGTTLTHLFGGSAGREGTALQTGASLADQITVVLRKLGVAFSDQDRRILLTAGISAGFGSVFGTPLAGAVFGLEVLTIGSVGYAAIFPCLAAAVVADMTTRAWHVHHTLYAIAPKDLAAATLTPAHILASLAAGLIFGLAAMAFARTTHALGAIFKRIPFPPLRPLVGGCLVAAAVLLSHQTQYIGLGIPTISASFTQHLPPWTFAGKFLFTTVTLASGFKGGEVTPLFYIGSTLGNALAMILPLAPSLLAAMGFVAVFAGAANTPIASTLMALELFGTEAGVFAAIACVMSYLFSGEQGIYRTQRTAVLPEEAE
ncbi:H+/Cl- antiporter ClcA [Granulicella rosea]|uniref:H+/Cl- antiporter ClcA n=1 Tax=Granulicella rosea TaxID=474952 RepID=A0A239H562_9BACT|nr:voltage-gated chloride channel family protein [Granulicella rosea]SNS75953.1 H+/Cl- antiporter ClcA [Granulicella rosea]